MKGFPIKFKRTLENVQHGCKVMIAINPATPLCVLEELIYYIDGINLLMVNPGFARPNVRTVRTYNKGLKIWRKFVISYDNSHYHHIFIKF